VVVVVTGVKDESERGTELLLLLLAKEGLPNEKLALLLEKLRAEYAEEEEEEEEEDDDEEL
jgi:hypothetical protein